ncbi:MAG: hypothetical protein ACTHNU_17210 [Gaiellales bacterium]
MRDAATYKSQGILVYTVLYGDQNVGSGSPACKTSRGANESPLTYPWDAMKAIASDPTNYYPDPNAANIENVFQKISVDMGAGSSRITQ